MNRVVTNTAVALIRAYKRFVSPLLPNACRYRPTCSEYAAEAVERFGLFRGGVKALGRLSRCHPFGGSGFDPVVPTEGAGCRDAVA